MFDALQYDFMQNAVMAGLLAALACGIIGTYIVVNRIVFMSGGIAHASFGGIGLGYFLGINPVTGALFFTVGSAIGMGLIIRRAKIAEDTAIGILWSIGMALGIILIDLSPGYAPDLFSYLFGNILTVPDSDLIVMLVLDALIVIAVLAFYKEFLAVSFDEEYSKIIGMRVQFLYILLLCLIALTVVLLIRVVGIILVIALLTIPATMAKQFTQDLRKMMLLAIIFGAVFTFGGLWLSYEFDVASGATIILLGGTVLLLTLWVSRFIERRRQSRKPLAQSIEETFD
ncbi:MAG: metal ABC transporter permease [Dehalococcoidia bacterium]